MLDVLVVGAGPAGRAVASACGERGLRTELWDPAPDRPWRATYGCWVDELPARLPGWVVSATARGYAIGRTRHDLGRNYAVLDTGELRRWLDRRLSGAGVAVRRGLIGTDRPAAAVVVDACGPAQPLSTHPHRGGTGRRTPARQCASGVVVPSALAAPLVGQGEALFMDWRPVPGVHAGPASFLYAVPLDSRRVLLEETSLAHRPGLPNGVLAERLHARLAGHGITPAPDAARELVRFPLDLPRHRAPGVLGFGAAAPLTHPATGYQLATALRLAEPLASALDEGLGASPEQALRRATAVLWPHRARLVHLLRRRGLECLLRLPPERLPDFFEAFFRLPGQAQRDFLDARGDPLRTFNAMARLSGRTDNSLRLRLIGSSLLVSAPPD